VQSFIEFSQQQRRFKSPENQPSLIKLQQADLQSSSQQKDLGKSQNDSALMKQYYNQIIHNQQSTNSGKPTKIQLKNKSSNSHLIGASNSQAALMIDSSSEINSSHQQISVGVSSKGFTKKRTSVATENTQANIKTDSTQKKSLAISYATQMIAEMRSASPKDTKAKTSSKEEPN
jgi:hypothetical protein